MSGPDPGYDYGYPSRVFTPPGVGAPAASDRGVISGVLDIIGRPYSAIMGGLTGMVDRDVGVAEGIGQGWRGERQFGAYDLLVNAGFDPEGRTARWGGLALDVLNPLDPMNYLTLGFNKAGSVAKGLQKVGAVAKGTEDVVTRAKAAEAGLYGLINLGGMTVTPKWANRAYGAGMDALGSRISRNAYYQKFRENLGGMGYQLERDEKLRELAELAKTGRFGVIKGDAEMRTQLVRYMEQVKEKTGSDLATNAAFRDAAPLLETPATSMARLKREYLAVETALARQDLAWMPETWATADEVDLIRRTAQADQANLAARSREIVERLGGRPGDAAEKAMLQDELWVLENLTRLDKGDMPPLDILHERRAKLMSDAGNIWRWHENAVAGAADAAELVAPRLKEAEGIIEGIGSLYEADYQLPVEHYLPHFFPVQHSRIKQWWDTYRDKRSLTANYAALGYSGDELKKKVREALRGREQNFRPVDSGITAGGQSKSFLHRQDTRSIREIQEAFASGQTPYQFEDHTAVLTMKAQQTAQRFKFSHDIHDYVRKQKGWTMDAGEWSGLSREEKRNWVPSNFRIPFLKDPKNDPFRTMYVRRDVQEVLGQQLDAVKMFTTETGQNALVQVLNSTRRWWSAWTLAPFPSYHMRNLVSDVVLAHQAGLNPVKDLARMTDGESAYGAAMAFAMKNAAVPFSDKEWQQAPASLDKFIGKMKEHFPDFDFDAMRNTLKRDRIIGENSIRDLEIDVLMSEDPIVKASMDVGKGKNWKNLTSLDPQLNPLTQKGFEEGRKIQEFSKVALWVHSAREALEGGAQTLEDVVNYATFSTRRALYDYQDLTSFERESMRLIMPFYSFTSKNLPRQMVDAVTRPGKLAWSARLYNQAWGQYPEEDLPAEAVPEWLNTSLGMPVRRDTDAEGIERYYLFSPMGWLPQTELNEVAEVMRSQGMALIKRLHPMLKEPFEQALNRDAFTGRELDSGEWRDLFGVPMPPRVNHLVRNIRLLNEIDRLNPGNLWTKVGQQLNVWEGDRPHRQEADQFSRFAKVLLGMSTYGVQPDMELAREIKSLRFEQSKAESQARMASMRGATLETSGFLKTAREKQLEARKAAVRLEELRTAIAARVAKGNR